MDLVNRTRYSARMISTVVEEERMMGSVIVKALLDIDGGRTVPSDLQTWPVGQEVETEFGTFDTETPFRKQGVDLMLLGKAYPPARGPANRTRVELGVDDFVYRVDVHGDRRWRRTDGGLVPGPADDFEAMPLTWERAYGGKCPVETGELPFHQNAEGRGFYVSEELAEEGVLPNLEDPDHPIRGWEDQPVPVGVAPLSRESSLRALNAIEMDLEARPPRLRQIKPSYFNNANPALILPDAPRPGATLWANGVRPGAGGISVPLPSGTFHVYVQLADRGYLFPTHLESITVLAEEQQLLLGFRCCFKYTLRPLERRAAILRGGSAPGEIPADYRIDWESFDDGEVVDG